MTSHTVDLKNGSLSRTLGVTAVFLAAASLLATYLLRPSTDAETNAGVELGTQLRSIIPDADPLLLDRASATWGYTAIEVAKSHGESGLGVLEAFGDESIYCWKHDRRAFESLTQLWKLEPIRFRLTTASWNHAVVDWAQNGKLESFLRKVEHTSNSSLSSADAVPAALPLLLDDRTPKTHAMLEKHGDRWRLFMSINFIDSPTSAERVAEALDNYGELILDLNDAYGLSTALMFVAPATKKDSRYVSDVAHHACLRLDRALAITLMLLNYDDVVRMLDAGTSLETLCTAIDLLAAQPEFVQMLSVECPFILRLLSETWGQQKVGLEAFRRCGPAATIAFDFYGSDRRMSQASIVAMGRIGLPAFLVLDRFREHGPFFDLLRRPELLQSNDAEPLVIDVIWNISRLGQDKIEIYRTVENVRREVMADRKPPPESEALLEWVPLYAAYRVGEKYLEGRHISNGELILATVDVALTVTPIKGSGKAASGAKTLATSLERSATEIGVKKVISQTERKALATAEKILLSNGEKGAVEVLLKEGAQVARFGPEAGKIAMKRLEARGDGIALGLADRSAEYAIAAKAGDLGKKSLIAEEIGMAGMEQYARETGRTPLYVGKPRQGAGFDGVFEDGNRILVIEAKGGGSQVKHFHGYWQGTPEYTREVANSVLARSSASAEEKSAATKVLKALDEGRLDIEVVRTEHVQGRPRPTRVESAVSTGTNVPRISASEMRSILLRTPGAALALISDNGLNEGRLAIESFISRSEAMAKRCGIELWKPGLGPLIPRVVRRKGQELTIRTLELPVAGEMSGVGEFAIAIMERTLP